MTRIVGRNRQFQVVDFVCALAADAVPGRRARSAEGRIQRLLREGRVEAAKQEGGPVCERRSFDPLGLEVEAYSELHNARRVRA
jgi:hypothetical protein